MTGSAISSLITSGKLLPSSFLFLISYFVHARSRMLSGNRFAAFEVSAVRGPLNPLQLSLPAVQLPASEMLNSLPANAAAGTRAT